MSSSDKCMMEKETSGGETMVESSSSFADTRILVSTQRLEATASISFCIHMYNAVSAIWVILNMYFCPSLLLLRENAFV